MQRISEKTLLAFMKFGGFCGGKLAMLLFHHKTRKKYFLHESEKLSMCLSNFGIITAYYILMT